MSSLFVQVTVVPMGTVIVCGPNTKLSIFTAFAAEGWSFAWTLDDPTNSSAIPISTGNATPATHIFFFAITLFPFYFALFAWSFLVLDWILVGSSQGLSQLP